VDDFWKPDELWEILLDYIVVNAYELLLNNLVERDIPNWDSLVNKKDEEKRTPLHKAADNGHKKIILTLLGNGAKVDEKDKAQRTPLHEAAANGYAEIIEILLGTYLDCRGAVMRLPASSNNMKMFLGKKLAL